MDRLPVERVRSPELVTGMRAVFVGEVDKGKVSGFHNWIAFQAQEAAGRLTYLGHLLPRGRCAVATDQHSSAVGQNRPPATARVAWSCMSAEVRSQLASGWCLPHCPLRPDSHAHLEREGPWRAGV